MIFSDTIIENKRFFLRNLVRNASSNWSTASSAYAIYTANYETPLGINRLYFAGCTYKFTTTNQSPTWAAFYGQNGYIKWGGAQVDNPTAGTEYNIIGFGRPSSAATITITYGTIYNGPNGSIAGNSAQVKNAFLYDVTELYYFLLARGLVTNETTMKTWCTTNLSFHIPYENFEITNIVFNNLSKVSIKQGSIITDDYIEPDGMRAYSFSSALRDNTYFDNGIGVEVYNNSGGGTVTHTRVSAQEQNSPFYPQHQYVLKITTNGTATPGAGGFVAKHTAAANKIFVEKFVAKVPVGYNVIQTYNAQGTGSSVTFLSSNAGTGDWAEYTVLYKCGSEGSFSSGGHVYISGSNNTSVTWYLAYVNNCEITGNEFLKNYTVLGNVDRIKAGTIFSRQFDNLNLVINGDGAKQEISMLTSGWEYDVTDVAGNAKASIVQPVNAASGFFGTYIPINPGVRYKLSFWVKCKGDMTSYLMYIPCYLADKTLMGVVSVNYKTGTKTQLKQALNSGDTVVKVKSNANWAAKNYSYLGFRSSAYISYDNNGYSNANGQAGIVDSITGTDTINLKVAYSGATKAVNTWIVESYSGSQYNYPVGKGSLPTNNTWKYIETYFGTNELWDGAGTDAWPGKIPADARYIRLGLNLYANTGTVPLKFSDIRIEPISTGSLARYENKIQVIGGM